MSMSMRTTTFVGAKESPCGPGFFAVSCMIARRARASVPTWCLVLPPLAPGGQGSRRAARGLAAALPEPVAVRVNLGGVPADRAPVVARELVPLRELPLALEPPPDARLLMP